MIKIGTAAALVCVTALASGPAGGAVISVKGRVESTKPGLLRLKTRTVLGLDKTVILRFEPEKVDPTGLLKPGDEEWVVDYDATSRAITRVARPQSKPMVVELVESRPRVKGEDAATWVLLVGIEDYENLDDLDYAIEDVQALERVYLTHGGVDPSRILAITDGSGNRPTSDLLPRQIRAFLSQVDEGDRVVVFFSGHGLVDKAQRGYLAASDCDPTGGESIARTSIAIDDLIGWMARCRASQKVLMLDACHSGAFTGRQLLPLIHEAEGVVTLASCRDDQVSLEDADAHQGLFTTWLIEALSGGADTNFDGAIAFDELYSSLNEATAGQSKQNPVRFIPANVEQPVVLTLHGEAGEVVRAQRLAAVGKHKDAFYALQELSKCDDPAVEYRRRDLMEEYSALSEDFFREECAKILAGVKAADLANHWVLARTIQARLMLAASFLGAGDRDGFRLHLQEAKKLEARKLPAGAEHLSLRVESAIALAEAMKLEEQHLGTGEDGGPIRKAVETQLSGILPRIMKEPDATRRHDLMARVAGAVRRLNSKTVFTLYTDTVRPYVNDAEWTRVLSLALADGGDAPGALQAMLTHEQQGERYRVPFPGRAMASAAVARSASTAGEMKSFDTAMKVATKWLDQDRSTRYTNMQPALAELAVAFARAGNVPNAEQWMACLKKDHEARPRVLAEIGIAEARSAKFDKSRSRLAGVTLTLDRLELCRVLGQFETIADPEGSSALLEWIGNLPTPQDRVAAYTGLIDGLRKKAWNRVASVWSDDYRRELLIEAGVAGPEGTVAAPAPAGRSLAWANDPGWGAGTSTSRTYSGMGSILNDVDTGFALASSVQNFAGGDYTSGAISLASLIAPQQTAAILQGHAQVQGAINDVNGLLQSMPGGGYIPGIPGIPGGWGYGGGYGGNLGGFGESVRGNLGSIGGSLGGFL